MSNVTITTDTILFRHTLYTTQPNSKPIVQTEKIVVIAIEAGIYMDVLNVATARKNFVSLELSMVE